MPAASHYRTLGVAPTATAAEVRAAYLGLARRHHPDLHADPGARARAETRMRAVNEAWAVLSDPVRRHRYDLTHRDPGPGGARPNGPHPAPPRRAWRPLDDDDDHDDDSGDERDEGQPLVAGSGTSPRAIQVGPPLLLLVALVASVLGGFTAIPGLAAFGAGCGALGAVLFAAAPLVTVRSAVRGRASVRE